jgi:MFS superfamily sulfate permease-like transporter
MAGDKMKWDNWKWIHDSDNPLVVFGIGALVMAFLPLVCAVGIAIFIVVAVKEALYPHQSGD